MSSLPFFLAICLLVLSVEANTCPNGWTFYCGNCYKQVGDTQSYLKGNKYYTQSTKALNQSLARQACANVGAKLVSIGDQAENDFLKQKFAGNAFWIGLSNAKAGEPVCSSDCRASMAGWVWEDRVTDYYSFNNWDVINGKKCAVMKESGQWDSEDCDADLRYHHVCEKGSFPYLGCYKDGRPRVLTHGPIKWKDMTNGKCAVYCRNQGYAYLGTQLVKQCFCGNVYDSLGTADNCNMTCNGDASQTCGGDLATSVYATKQTDAAGKTCA